MKAHSREKVSTSIANSAGQDVPAAVERDKLRKMAKAIESGNDENGAEDEAAAKGVNSRTAIQYFSVSHTKNDVNRAHW